MTRINSDTNWIAEYAPRDIRRVIRAQLDESDYTWCDGVLDLRDPFLLNVLHNMDKNDDQNA